MIPNQARKIIEVYANRQRWTHREVRGLLEEFLNERPDLLSCLISFLSEAADAADEPWMRTAYGLSKTTVEAGVEIIDIV